MFLPLSQLTDDCFVVSFLFSGGGRAAAAAMDDVAAAAISQLLPARYRDSQLLSVVVRPTRSSMASLCVC